jgi:hypothetical protein
MPEAEEASLGNVNEDVALFTNDFRPALLPARKVHFGEHLLGEAVVRAGCAKRVKVMLDEHGTCCKRVRVAHALGAPVGRDKLEESRPKALEPAFLHQAMGEQTCVVLRCPQRLAQLGQCDAFLVSPLEIEDNLGLVLRFKNVTLIVTNRDNCN